VLRDVQSVLAAAGRRLVTKSESNTSDGTTARDRMARTDATLTTTATNHPHQPEENHAAGCRQRQPHVADSENEPTLERSVSASFSKRRLRRILREAGGPRSLDLDVAVIDGE
jgi:hypothetical protein